MKRALAFAISLPLVSAIGAYFISSITPYIIIVAIAIIFLLVLWDKLDKRYYPLYLFGISLAVLWGTSMLGQHIVGNDIHSEYYIVTQNMQTGWNISLHNGNNTSLALGWLAPMLGRLGFDPIWQFKLLYPFLFSFVPVLLYIAYKKLFNNKIAFIAGLFIIIMPMFTLDMTSHVKGMVAQIGLAAILPLLVCEMKTWQRIVGLVLASLVFITNHYTIAAIGFMYMLGMVVILIIAKFSLIKRMLGTAKAKLKYAVIPLIIVLTVGIGYYSIAAEGAMLQTFGRVGVSITRIIGIIIKNESNSTLTPEEIIKLQEQTGKPIDRTEEYLQGAYDKRTQPVEVTGTYLDKQEQTIRTALGLDFFTATIAGKIFRILQFITQIAIAIGVLLILFKWKQIALEYKALVITGFGILLACLFVPYVSTTVSATRFYGVSLYFLAPAFVIGLSWIARKKWLIAILFLAYFAFTSGLAFEVSKDTELSKVNIPYSLALSNYRMNINGMANSDDIAVAKWLAYSADKNISRLSDYNGLQLLSEYNPIGILYTVPDKPYYFFSTSWSTENNKLVYAKAGGLRTYTSMIDFSKASIAYQQRDAIVYVVR
jgi:uncharacterized membrane protein